MVPESDLPSLETDPLIIILTKSGDVPLILTMSLETVPLILTLTESGDGPLV